MKAFISIPVTGTCDASERAADAELNIVKFFDPRKVYNPVYAYRPMRWKIYYIILRLAGADDRTIWLHYMAETTRNLYYCNTIFMCLGWERSEGCRIEHEIAMRIGIDIFYETKGMSWKKLR